MLRPQDLQLASDLQIPRKLMCHGLQPDPRPAELRDIQSSPGAERRLLGQRRGHPWPDLMRICSNGPGLAQAPIQRGISRRNLFLSAVLNRFAWFNSLQFSSNPHLQRARDGQEQLQKIRQCVILIGLARASGTRYRVHSSVPRANPWTLKRNQNLLDSSWCCLQSFSNSQPQLSVC